MELPIFLEETLSGESKPISFQIGGVSKTLNVKIPAGVTDGERIRLKGQGAPGIGGRATGGSFTTPSGSSYVHGGVPRAGGTVTTSNLSGGKTTTVRGGFGSKGFAGGG